MTSPVAERLLTEDEFLALPKHPEGRKRELLDGNVIVHPHNGYAHSTAGARLVMALHEFTRGRRSGEVFFNVGYLLRTSPDRIVCPDVSVARYASFPTDLSRTLRGGPLLAIEVRSPEDIPSDIAAKIAEYLEAGSARVWDVDPARKTVAVHRPGEAVRVLAVGETLTSDDAGFDVKGFSLPVADIFDSAAV